MAMIRTRVVQSFSDVDGPQWDDLVADDNNPFVEYAFLKLLEDSGSIGPETSWRPRLVLAERDGRLVGALPAFWRSDSYGEFIFDWQLADAARRVGLRYFPKITVAVPFTPATGPRFLGAADVDTRQALKAGLRDLQESEGAHSTHVLFCNDDEADALVDDGYARRASLQFHWRNDGYRDFDDFLSRLSHEARKQIRRERRRVQESGLVTEVMLGHEVPAHWWPGLYRLYAGIYDRKWGSPYLRPAFFDAIATVLPERAVVAVARDPSRPRDDDVVAMTLSFERGTHCYGRYWGCDVELPGLHFELCYYALVERAIARGQTLMEAGAQGEHKLKRGFLPVITHSAHRFAEPGFHDAIARFYDEETQVMEAERSALCEHGPFKEGTAPLWPLRAGIPEV